MEEVSTFQEGRPPQKFAQYLGQYYDNPAGFRQAVDRGEFGPFSRELERFVARMPEGPSGTLFAAWPPELVAEQLNDALPVNPDELSRELQARQDFLAGYAAWYAQHSPLDDRAEAEVVSDPVETPAPAPEKSSDDEEKVEYPPEKTLRLNENIERTSEQEVIGDLNGSWDSLVAHLRNRDLAKSENGSLTWTGGNKRLTLLGDILGDRSPEGIKIYEALNQLRTQAEQAGGSIDWLAGNHENMFQSLLFGHTSEFGTTVEADASRLSQYAGNLELLSYLPDEAKERLLASLQDDIASAKAEIGGVLAKRRSILKTPDLDPNARQAFAEKVVATEQALGACEQLLTSADPDADPSPQLLSILPYLKSEAQGKLSEAVIQNRSSILEGMKEANPGFIEALRHQKLVTLQDDVLYVHTNLTDEMMEFLKAAAAGEGLAAGIDKINAYYQSIIEAYLGGREPQVGQLGYFNQVRDAFISTSSASRINYSESSKLSDTKKQSHTAQLQAWGVSAVVHGHNKEAGGPKGTSEVPILSIDTGVYNIESGSAKTPTSAATITTGGQLQYH